MHFYFLPTTHYKCSSDAQVGVNCIVGSHWDLGFFLSFFFSLLSVINFSALVLEVVSIQVKVFEVCLHVEAQRDHLRACVVA